MAFHRGLSSKPPQLRLGSFQAGPSEALGEPSPRKADSWGPPQLCWLRPSEHSGSGV